MILLDIKKKIYVIHSNSITQKMHKNIMKNPILKNENMIKLSILKKE
jgi:hypothetical protein